MELVGEALRVSASSTNPGRSFRSALSGCEQMCEALAAEEREVFREWCSLPSARRIDPGPSWRLVRADVAPFLEDQCFLQTLRRDVGTAGTNGQPLSQHENSKGTSRSHRVPTGRGCGTFLWISRAAARSMICQTAFHGPRVTRAGIKPQEMGFTLVN